MIKGLIFDLDGVIVDTAKYHYKAWFRLAESQGIIFSEEENENLKGVGRMESLEYILGLGNKKLPAAEKKKLAYTKNEWYKESISAIDENDMLPGAYAFLQEALDNKYRIALGSASKNAEMILNTLGIYDLFETIIDGTKTTRSKPDPQVFQMAAKELNLNPNECIVFEDAIKGIEAAKVGGFYAVGIGDYTTLIEADEVVTSLAEFKLESIRSITKLGA